MVYPLGGASWPRLGSDGSWQGAFAGHGARIAPLKPSNSGFLVSWSEIFKGNLFFGEDLMEIPLGAPGPRKLD